MKNAWRWILATALAVLPFAAGAQTPPRAVAKVLMTQELPAPATTLVKD